jgi:hypothetical protein
MSYSSSVIPFFCVYSLPRESAHQTVAYQWTSASAHCCENVRWASRWLVMDFSSDSAIVAFRWCLPSRCLAMVILVTICFAFPTHATCPEFWSGYIKTQIQLHLVWSAVSGLPLALHSSLVGRPCPPPPPTVLIMLPSRRHDLWTTSRMKYNFQGRAPFDTFTHAHEEEGYHHGQHHSWNNPWRQLSFYRIVSGNCTVTCMSGCRRGLYWRLDLLTTYRS